MLLFVQCKHRLHIITLLKQKKAAINPIRRPRDDEMTDLASKNTDSVTKAFQAGMVSQRTALKELRQQAEMTGMWSNITDEDIETPIIPFKIQTRAIYSAAWKKKLSLPL